MEKEVKVLFEKILYEVDYLVNKMSKATLEKFLSSEGKKRLAGMTFINIGEYLWRLPKDIFEPNQKAFNEFVAISRNIVSNYENWDFTQMWDDIQVRLPELKEKINELL